MNKVNYKQHEAISSMEFLLNCWRKTNDITSGTLSGDITEEIHKALHLEEREQEILIEKLENLLYFVQTLK